MFTLSVQDPWDDPLSTLFVDTYFEPCVEDLQLDPVDIEFFSYDKGDINDIHGRAGVDAGVVITRLESMCRHFFQRCPRWTPCERQMVHLMDILTYCLELRPGITALCVRTGFFNNVELDKAILQLPEEVGLRLQSINIDGITWETSRASSEGGEDTIRLKFQFLRDPPPFW